MELIVKIFYCFCLVSITGAMTSVIWYALGRLLERAGFLNIVYKLLKATLFFWFFPISFCTLEVCDKCFEMWHGVLFLRTPFVDRISNMVAEVWLFIALLGFINYMFNIIMLYRKVNNSIICDKNTMDIFYEVCDEYEINPEDIKVRFSYTDRVPKVAFCIRPVILLPVEGYDDDMLRVIFKHELIHIKHHDILYKNIFQILCVLHFYNPAIWWMRREYSRWNEFACDYEICINEQNVKNYYEKILSISAFNTEPRKLISTLFENKNEVRERLQHVLKSYKVKNKSSVKAGILVIGIMAISLICTSVVSVNAADYVESIYWKTHVAREERMELELFAEENQEYVDDDILVEYDVGSDFEKAGGDISWNMKSKCQRRSTLFYIKKGQRIEMAITADDNVQVGIVLPDSTLRYVHGDKVTHSFIAETSGQYCIYIQNSTNKPVSVYGGYVTKK